MTISCLDREPEVIRDQQHLEDILKQRDARGGGEFWLADGPDAFPSLSIVVSGEMSFAIYFPEAGHPGFRCLRPGADQPAIDGSTNFLWVGCDPASGELVPNEFVVPFSTSVRAAHAFFRDRSLPKAFQWFEL